MRHNVKSIENTVQVVIEINGIEWYIGMPNESNSVFGSSLLFGDCRFPSLKELNDARAELCQHLEDDFRFYDFFDENAEIDSLFVPTSTLSSPTEVYLFDMLSGKTKSVSRYKMLDAYFYEGICVPRVDKLPSDIVRIDGIVVDVRTGLMWEECDFFVTEDSDFVQDSYFFGFHEEVVKKAKNSHLFGFCDWFLPSEDEMYTHMLIAKNDIRKMYELASLFGKKANLPMQFWITDESNIDAAKTYSHIFSEPINNISSKTKQSSMLVREIKIGEYDWLFGFLP